jgi:hypothetical protein
MKITEKTLEDKIAKTEEKLELLRSQLKVLRNQRMIDLNPTTVVVREAMRIVSKDVRAPLVVRMGTVKRKAVPNEAEA